jgi:hypothetical protein
MKLKKLIKSLNLFEGKLEVRPHYPKITDDDFDMLINLDPTYNGGNELGKYSKWILNLYNKVIKDKLAYEKWVEQKKMGNNFPPPMRKTTDKQEDFETIPNLLRQFNVLNNKLKTNIDNIKSISELYKVVHDAKDKGLSANSKVQKGLDLFKKSVQNGGEVVFKNSNWVILVPKTLESSVVFGEDTNWCTTAPNGRMYYRYLEIYGGQYFINLNLQTGDLYQFHFESKQFMNSDDSKIKFQDTIKDDSVIKFYLNYLYNNIKDDKTINTALLTIILEIDNNPPEQVQLMAVQQDGYNIKYIKNPSEQLQIEAVKQNGNAIEFIQNPTEEMQLMAVNYDGYALGYIKNPSEKVQMAAIKQNGKSIVYIDNPTEEMKLEAVKQDGYAIEFIKNPSEEIQSIAVNKSIYAIKYIDNPSEEIQSIAVNRSIYAIQYIKNPSEEIQLKAVRKDGDIIRYIKTPSEKVQLMAVKCNADSIRFIDNPSEKVQLAAVNQNGYAIDYIDNPTEKVKEYAEKKKTVSECLKYM